MVNSFKVQSTNTLYRMIERLIHPHLKWQRTIFVNYNILIYLPYWVYIIGLNGKCAGIFHDKWLSDSAAAWHLHLNKTPTCTVYHVLFTLWPFIAFILVQKRHHLSDFFPIWLPHPSAISTAFHRRAEHQHVYLPLGDRVCSSALNLVAGRLIFRRGFGWLVARVPWC